MGDLVQAGRRSFLRRSAFGVAAALGLGAGGRALVRDDGSAATVAVGKGQTTLTLRGADWRLVAPYSKAGVMPAAEAAPATHGRIVAQDGTALGQFQAAAVPGAAGRFQLHSFELTDGSILGMGAGALDDAVFAIVGGTGRWQGATGSYVARQRPRELGGDGTAEFILNVTMAGETTDGV